MIGTDDTALSETVIRLVGEARAESGVHVSSPDLALLHIVIQNEDELLTVVLPVVQVMLEHKYQCAVELRLVKTMEAMEGLTEDFMRIPTHVIASMAGSLGNVA